MNPEQLQQVEELAQQAYNSTVPAERALAEERLRVLSASPENSVLCRYILDNSRSPFALTIASQSLFKLVTHMWAGFTPAQHAELYNYLLTYLATFGQSLQQYILASLLQTLARVIKFGWFEEPSQDIVDNVDKFLKASLNHYVIGLRILNELIVEMNLGNQGHLSLSQHRKVAVSFRDKALLRIFQLALNTLGQVAAQAPALQDDRVQGQGLKLALHCLSFDFIGTIPDESSEDLGIVQIPSSWRFLFEDPATLGLFFRLYATLPSHTALAMECLVQMASVRRSLFVNEDDRAKYLAQLLAGILDVLRNRTGLSVKGNHHEFSRLLARLKSNYQLTQLVATDGYPEWIRLVAEFTVASIKTWDWAPNSIHFILGLWSRFIASMSYLKATTPALLDGYAPQIMQAYITACIENAQRMLDSEEPTLFESEEHLSEHLEALPYLGRCKYQQTSSFLISLIDPLTARFQAHITPGQGAFGPQNDLYVTEAQLAWLVYIIGATVGGRIGMNSHEEHDLLDGELASRVFQLLRLHDARLNASQASKATIQLELSLLYFIHQFRKAYIGDNALTSSKVYNRLAELLGLSTHHMVLNLILGKITANLKYWAREHAIITKTLVLFHDLSSGYSSGKMLIKLDITSQILSNHTSEHFPFLDHEANTRDRTTFYATLGRLLFADENIARFDEFIAPLDHTLRSLGSLPSVEAFRHEQVKRVVIGAFRDLRGLVSSSVTRRAYNSLFDWLHPKHTPVLHMVAEAWYDAPEVTTPLLKFMAEFVLNKSGRLTFDSSSPNGILLFREVSKLIVTYGSRVTSPALANNRDAYKARYKGIWLCLTIMKNALSGNYVNFGVFALYGDTALANALAMSLNISLAIPLPELLSFPKFSRAFFGFVEAMCTCHTALVAELDTPVFAQLVLSLQEGINGTDSSIVSQCCLALDNLVTFYYQNCRKDTPAARALNQHLAQNPELFPRILDILFRYVLYEDSSNQWSLSRPLLCLIIVCPKHFLDVKAQVVNGISADKRERVLGIFAKLMEDVHDSLELKNRDKFTSNLTHFKHEIKSYIAS